LVHCNQFTRLRGDEICEVLQPIVATQVRHSQLVTKSTFLAAQACHVEDAAKLMAQLPAGSTAEQQLQLAEVRMRVLEGQVVQVRRRHKAQLDDLTGQLEGARGVQLEWGR
jgi:hypothetical protein